MYAGPIWDHDLCYGIGYGNREVASNPENFHMTTKYLAEGLIQIESFRDAVKKALNKQNGEFYKAAKSLLGSDGIIAQHSELVNQQQKLNFKLWDVSTSVAIVVKPGAEKNYNNAVEFLEYFVDERLEWLADITSTWNGNNYSVPTDYDEEEKELSFFEKIVAFFQSILDWLLNLFNF